jgi:NADH:ubiquinone oxidoreductase subunit 2 (subunit N)
MTLIIIPILVLSCKSWLITWIILEISSIIFIILIIKEKTYISKENSIKYFIIQISASTLLLIAFLSQTNIIRLKKIIIIILPITLISISIGIKIAAAPFQIWIPPLSKRIKWTILIIITTWQKIIPITILIKNRLWIITIVIAISSIYIGVISQYNITSTKIIIVFSSLTHLRWILISIKRINLIPLAYLFIYMIISIPIIINFNKINIKNLIQQIDKDSKFKILIMILSLAGIPPTIGFILKWIILHIIIQNIKNILIISVIIILSTINFFIYIRITLNSIINQNKNYLIKFNQKNKIINLFNIIIPTLIIWYPKYKFKL